MDRISRKAAAHPVRTRLFLVAFFAILISIPILSQGPPATDRAAQFRRMSEEAEKKGLAEPFKGITTDGHLVPGLFAIRSTGVSTEPARKAPDALLSALTKEQPSKTMFQLNAV